MAQSLDLPPRAARWRHQQRRTATGEGAIQGGRGRIYDLPPTAVSDEGEGDVSESDHSDCQEGSRSRGRLTFASLWKSGGEGGGQGWRRGGGRGDDEDQRGLRQRVEGMLEKERED